MKTKTVKIALEGFGSFLGAREGCFVVRDRLGRERRYPLVENQVAEIQVKSGNFLSSGALAKAAFWNIDTMFLTQRGNPIAVLRSLTDDSHVATRIAQYEALRNEKGLEIAKQFVLGKLKGSNLLLKKYGLRSLDTSRYSQEIKSLEEKDLDVLRNRLTSIEGKFSKQYISQVVQLFSESFRPERRRGFKAYDGLNNILNLAYRILSWKIHIALIKAKLEPYLGFLHSIQWGTPSLVCDFQELYRHLIDDFVINYCLTVEASDFVLKEDCSANRRGKRQYLNEKKNRDLLNRLERFLEKKVALSRMRRGKYQEIATVISEEALLFAKHLRKETDFWGA